MSLAADVNTPNKEEDIKALVEALKKILNDELPYYPILYKTYSAVVSNELTGDIAPMFCNYYVNCGKWYSSYKITNTEE